MKKMKITIEGMHCASCASNVERVLKKISGVSEANVVLMLNKANIQADDSVSEEEVKKAVSKLGYKVSKIE